MSRWPKQTFFPDWSDLIFRNVSVPSLFFVCFCYFLNESFKVWLSIPWAKEYLFPHCNWKYLNATNLFHVNLGDRTINHQAYLQSNLESTY